jgi:bacillithiol system protein YtxJ
MINITTNEEWIALKAKCAEEQKQLFLAKLSPACPVSHMAEAELEQWLPTHPQNTFIAARIDVIRCRNLARAIATEVKVKHESPQVLLLDASAQATWDIDHSAINAENLDQQFPK